MTYEPPSGWRRIPGDPQRDFSQRARRGSGDSPRQSAEIDLFHSFKVTGQENPIQVIYKLSCRIAGPGVMINIISIQVCNCGITKTDKHVKHFVKVERHARKPSFFNLILMMVIAALLALGHV